MSRVLIVEDSPFLANVLAELMNKYTNFEYDLALNYKEAEELLEKHSYDYAITDLHLPDVKTGQIIPLVNQYNIAPIVFTSNLNKEFRESFETARIVDYVLKERYENVVYVIEKTLQLEANKQKTILIVDDSMTYRYYLKHNLKMHNFVIIEASDGAEALRKLKHENGDIDLVIVDYYMPIMDGLEFTRKARKLYTKKELSIIALTADENSYTTSLFLKEGANDYISKPFSRDEFYARIYQNMEQLDLFEQTQAIFDDDVFTLLCEMTEYKSTETGNHIRRIQAYTEILCKQLGYPDNESKLIAKISALHDVGKIAIKDSVLNKPSKLDNDEHDHIKSHTTVGKSLLEDAFKSDPKIGKIAIEIAYMHHERYDGTGYPQQLIGDDIPMCAQIVSISDCYDALMHKRVYKEAWKESDVINYIEDESGKAFNPKVVHAFLQSRDNLKEVTLTYADKS
jgi:putative two-component system response regulator